MTATESITTGLTATVKAGHREYVIQCANPYYQDPLVLVSGSGTNVVDAEGREYLDFFSGILTTSLGHCHPEVVERIREQVGRLGHTSTLYLSEPLVKASKRLASLAPGKLKRTFFTNSGSEAVETAIMLARMYTGRDEIVALRYAYSGRTHMATNLGAQSAWRPLTASVPWIKHAMSPYCYRCPFGP